MNIIETEKELTFPKSGMYIVLVRARAELTDIQINSLTSLTKEELIQKMINWNLEEDVGDTLLLTADQIKAKIIEVGIASAWSSSIDSTYAVVDDEPRSWWIYSYIAPPPPVVIIDGP